MPIDRRTALIGAGASAISASEVGAGPPETATSVSQRLEAAGFAGDLGDKLEWGIKSGLLRGMHGVVVTRAGKVVFERYLEGEDEAWGVPLGRVLFNANTLHDIRSVTKSVVSLLYGIALERGLVPGPDAKLLAQFPEYADLIDDPQRSALTVEHALNMTLGTEWDEQLPYTDPANSEIRMEMAKDRNRFVLDRPIVAAPGTRWSYNGGCVALLGHLIARGAKTTLAEFARTALFQPLGITAFDWAKGTDGVESAASGLRMRPRDLARIGDLMLAHGALADAQIIPRAWLAAIAQPAIPADDGLQYSRFWYQSAEPVPGISQPVSWLAGFGNGGQRLFVMPSLGISVVVTAGNYNTPYQWVAPSRIWREIVLRNLAQP